VLNCRCVELLLLSNWENNLCNTEPHNYSGKEWKAYKFDFC